MAKVWDHFWTRLFLTEFVPQINAIVDVLEKRLLPNFEGIEKESERVAEEAWERFMSMGGTGDEDPADFADKVLCAGISHHELMHGIRQGMLNLVAVALFHAFEQQVIFFHRKNILHPKEENDPEQLKLSVFQCRLRKFGINIKQFTSWPKIYDELRLIANTVKHAEGKSSQELCQIRPDMFMNPLLSGFSSGPVVPVPQFQPLVGYGLYVSLQDIKAYRCHLVGFWQELHDVMQCD